MKERRSGRCDTCSNLVDFRVNPVWSNADIFFDLPIYGIQIQVHFHVGHFLAKGNQQLLVPIYMGVLLSDICVDYLPEKWHAKLYDEITVKTLVWYSRSVHPEKWHALYEVNACENHYPGKWQAMHDANACENYIAIILWQQSPCFKCMWIHQCIAKYLFRNKGVFFCFLHVWITCVRRSLEANPGLSTSNLFFIFISLGISSWNFVHVPKAWVMG